MISSACFMWSLLGPGCLRHTQLTEEGPLSGGPESVSGQLLGELLAAGGEFWRPPAGRFLSAYGEDLRAVDTGDA